MPQASSRSRRTFGAITVLVMTAAGCAGTPETAYVTIPPERVDRLIQSLSTPVDQPPMLKDPVAHPYYPKEVIPDKRPGMVLLKIDVDAKGRVTAVDVIESTALIFESQARQAARQWSFEPARRDGVNVPATIVVPVEFSERK